MSEYVIAKYLRLSVDDVITESLSIPNQRSLLDKHIEELEIPGAEILEFVDNGHSGTNMERPAVQEMIDLVRSGKVNCVCVKDFSRFSRNALDSGYFVEQVFPLYRVRFISVSDGFDTDDYKNDTGGIDIAFKFLMHEYYSIDLSKKVKSAKRIRMAMGDSIVANAIYGYRKNSGGKWEPDPEPAKVVQMIFMMALEGRTTGQIRDKLCAAKYPTPREYIEMRRGKDIAPQCMWTARMVLHTLDNEQYAGSYVAGKYESKAVGSHSKNLTDKSDWIVIPNRHPAIISKKDFDEAREIRARLKGSTTDKPLKSDMTCPKRARMLSGERISSVPIYGYVKAESGNLEIDRDAGDAVRQIYEMAAHGLSYAEISGALFNAGFPTPSEYVKRARGHNIMPTNRWTVKSVRSILQNVQYTGAYVSGKILKDYETGRNYHTAKSEWIVITGKHPAIVGKELFAEVQEIIKSGRKNSKNKRRRDYLLTGKVACGCCGHALSYDNSRVNAVYRCGHTYADPSAECYKMKVVALELDAAILNMIRKQAEAVLNSGDLSELRKKSAEAHRVSDYEAQINQIKEQRQNCYERFILREIERNDYLSLKTGYTEKIDRLNERLAVLKQVERDRQASQEAAAIAKDTLRESADSREIVDALIEKIYVFPGDRIEVNWKIADFAAV